METENTTKTAAELAQEKADQLAEQLGTKVYPLIFKEEEDGEDIIGYIKEPSRAVKMAVLDKSVMGSVSAAAEMLDLIILKEHSDPRIFSEKPEHDKIYIGAVMAAFDLIKFSKNTAKKKN